MKSFLETPVLYFASNEYQGTDLDNRAGVK